MIDFFTNAFDFIMTPLFYAVSFVMVTFHQLLTPLFGASSGITWALSIVGLTLVIRALLIPLFVKQIKSSRNMQLIQPKVKELQKKYSHDREKLAQETMALYRESGTNPFASCLPILLQMPIFFSLFRLIQQATQEGQAHGVLTENLVEKMRSAEILGVRIGDSFMGADGDIRVMVFAAVLVVIMVVTMFLTQRQLMSKNMPADAMSGPFAQQQKMLLYVLPLVFAVGGVAFPIGVLFYWTTSNLWTMGQQFYVIRRNPAPGTPAYEAKQEREAAKARRKGEPVEEQTEPDADVEGASAGSAGTTGSTGDGQATSGRASSAGRQQPQRQSRSARKSGQHGGGGGSGGQKSGGQKSGGQKSGAQKSGQGKKQ